VDKPKQKDIISTFQPKKPTLHVKTERKAKNQKLTLQVKTERKTEDKPDRGEG
jgi:hypothetical protein